MSRESIIGDLWHQVYGAIAGGRCYGEKYNENLLFLNPISQCLPACKFIFVARNGLTVAQSFMTSFRHKVWAPSDIQSALKKWTIWNNQWAEMRDQLSGRYIEVRYEDFVAHPGKTYDRLCHFLSLPIHAADRLHWQASVREQPKRRCLAPIPDSEDRRLLHIFGY